MGKPGFGSERYIRWRGGKSRKREFLEDAITVIQIESTNDCDRPAFLSLPHMAEIDMPRSLDAAGEYTLYDDRGVTLGSVTRKPAAVH
jgi:hypothetical protein